MSQEGLTNRVIDLIDALGNANNKEQIWNTCQTIFYNVGAEWTSIGSAPIGSSQVNTIHSNASHDFVRGYIDEKIFEVDPWMTYCQASYSLISLPLDERSSSGNSIDKERSYDRRFLEYMRSHGIKHASLIPTSSRITTAGVVLIARNNAGATELTQGDIEKFARITAALFSHNFLNDASSLADYKTYHTARPISTREREVLQWLAVGLQTQRIAEKMGIEPVTVSKHFVSVRMKLRARTREQALAIAIAQGIISL